MNNSVHQVFLVSGSIRTALQAGDTITIGFSGAVKSSRFGSIQFISGCGSEDKPDTTVVRHGYGMAVTAPLQTSVPGEIIVGVIQTDRRKDPVYAPGSWKQIGTSDNYGESAGKVGLQNIYLSLVAKSPASYRPDGSFNLAKSWSFIAAAFKPLPATGR